MGAPNGSGGGTSGSSAEAGAGGADNDELAALPSQLHRLNRTEYRATVRDVLGVDVDVPNLPRAELNGYDNAAAVLGMRADWLQMFLTAAKDAVQLVFEDAKLEDLQACVGVSNEACASKLIASLGLKLFRRPLLEAELPSYTKLYDLERRRGATHEVALRQVVVALLVSAQFLYRTEWSSATAPQLLSPYELASRLSYLIWNSAPDERLLTAAANDALAQDAELQAELPRLWGSGKSERFVESFAGQWLGARRVVEHAVLATTYPTWSPKVALAAQQEMLGGFDDILRSDLELAVLLRGKSHAVEPELAPFYGLSVPRGDAQPMVPEGERAGYLGSVGFLTITSNDRGTSPTQRGRFILTHLLCQPPPAPPEVLPLLGVTPPSSVREGLQKLDQDPKCNVCHRSMDPLGLALEHYDGIGRYRDNYENGMPVDSQAHWAAAAAAPDGVDLASVADVAEVVSKDPAFHRCIVENLYDYSFGASGDATHERNIARLTKRWQAGPLTLKRLVEALVLSKAFRYRNPGGMP